MRRASASRNLQVKITKKKRKLMPKGIGRLTLDFED